MRRGPTRRAWVGLAAGAVLFPRLARAAAASRIVCLEWTAAETLLGLGLEPLAAGDVPDYATWVAAPPMPAGVVDLGSRFEPNRELLHRLKPDLVIVTKGYGVDTADMARFGPVHEMSPFEDGVGAIDHARSEAARLAERLGRQQAGHDLERATDLAIARAAAALASIADQPVAVVSIFEERSVRIYGGGLIDDVLKRVGLRSAWTKDVGPWGFAYTGLERLALLEPETRLVLLDPVPPPIRIRLEASSLWRHLPVVAAGRVFHMAPVWPFGGLAAAGRFAAGLSAVLAAS